MFVNTQQTAAFQLQECFFLMSVFFDSISCVTTRKRLEIESVSERYCETTVRLSSGTTIDHPSRRSLRPSYYYTNTQQSSALQLPDRMFFLDDYIFFELVKLCMNIMDSSSALRTERTPTPCGRLQPEVRAPAVVAVSLSLPQQIAGLFQGGRRQRRPDDRLRQGP